MMSAEFYRMARQTRARVIEMEDVAEDSRLTADQSATLFALAGQMHELAEKLNEVGVMLDGKSPTTYREALEQAGIDPEAWDGVQGR